MRNSIIKISISVFLAVSIASCKKDQPPVKQNFTGTITTGQRVFVSCEGGFGYGNSTITLYDPQSGNTVADIYKSNNNNQSLGDVCQSLYINDNRIYAVINNSNKIVVMDKNNYQKQTTITGFNSPRYVLQVSNNKAYVSDLYSNSISIVDLSANTRTGSISCPGWTEEMALSYGKAFITNVKRNYLYIINTSTDQIIDSIQIAYGAGSIVKDKNEKLWITCSGDSAKSSLPMIVRINPVSNTVEQSFVFPHYNTTPSNLKINGSGDRLYYLNSSIYYLDITATNLNSSAFISRGSHLFYGMGINPVSGDVYVSDAIDYVQNGKVMIYNSSGQYLKTFDAGIIPGNFYFVE